MGGAVCFLWHFPSAELELGVPDVIRHTALRSSDFPPRPFHRLLSKPIETYRMGGAAVRSGCLQMDYMRTLEVGLDSKADSRIALLAEAARNGAPHFLRLDRKPPSSRRQNLVKGVLDEHFL